MNPIHTAVRLWIVLMFVPMGTALSESDSIKPEAELARPVAQSVYRIRQSVALTGRNRLFVGEPSSLKPIDQQQAGLVEFRSLNDDQWSDPLSLQPSGLKAGDQFGCAVSAVDAQALGGHPAVLIGAPGDDQGDTMAGAAYLYYYACTEKPPYICGWFSKKWIAPFPGQGGKFGKAVALAQDWALVGAPWEGDGMAGTVHVYRRDFGPYNFSHAGTLTLQNGAYGDEFGASVSIDGEYAVVGAPGRSRQTFSHAGVANVYRLNSAQVPPRWELITTLQPQGKKDGRFGECVWVEGDQIIVGAPGDGQEYLGTTLGKVYFPRVKPGGTGVDSMGTLQSDPAPYFIGNLGYQLSVTGQMMAVRSASVHKVLHNPPTTFHYELSDIVLLFRYDPDQRQWLYMDASSVGWEYEPEAEIFGGVAINHQRLVADVPYDGQAKVFKICPFTDFTGDCHVDLEDLSVLIRDWMR